MKKKLSSSIFEIAASAVTALAVVSVLFAAGFRITTVDGESMLPTLRHGDRLVTAGFYNEYDYKDIIIVVEPNEQLYKPLVKRVIATPGQWVDIRYDEGLVYVGDTPDTLEPLDEAYTAELTTHKPYEDMNEYPICVPEDCYFAMGDNRNHSTDSRSYKVGFVDENYILGKALFRFLPFGEFGIY